MLKWWQMNWLECSRECITAVLKIVGQMRGLLFKPSPGPIVELEMRKPGVQISTTY